MDEEVYGVTLQDRLGQRNGPDPRCRTRGGDHMAIKLNRVGHIGIHVSDTERSIAFYRKVLGLKLTGKWGPPDIRRPICFMRIGDAPRRGVVRTAGGRAQGRRRDPDSAMRKAPGLDHIAFEVSHERMAQGARPRACMRRRDPRPLCARSGGQQQGLSAAAAVTPSTSSTRTATGSGLLLMMKVSGRAGGAKSDL